MTPVSYAWLAELVIIAYRGGKQLGKQRPIDHLALPAEYASTFLIYGALSLVPESSPLARPAAVFGWGIVLATALNLWDPSTIGNTGGPAVKQTEAFITTGAPSNNGRTTV
jgi:hypothetical protein